MERIEFGRCDCGGYGQLFPPEAHVKMGRCHVPTEELRELLRKQEAGEVSPDRGEWPAVAEDSGAEG